MHFQIFQMALNSCCTFWRPSICEISLIWSFLCASFCFFLFFLSILSFLPYSFLPSPTLRLLVILANIFINSRHIFWYLDAWIPGLLIDIFGGPHQSVACFAWSWGTIRAWNWQSRIIQKKSGSFNNDQNVYFLAVFKFFVKFFDFSRTNWYYMLKGTIKSYHPWKNE